MTKQDTDKYFNDQIAKVKQQRTYAIIIVTIIVLGLLATL